MGQLFDSVFVQYKTHAMFGWRDSRTKRFVKWSVVMPYSGGKRRVST